MPGHSLVQCDEELAAICVLLVGIGTCHQASVGEAQPAVELISEGGPVDGLSTCSRCGVV